VGTVWLGASAAGTGLGWFEQLGVLLSPPLVAALAIGAPAAVLSAIAGSGRAAVRWHVPTRRAAGLATLAACAAMAGDSVLLAGTLSPSVRRCHRGKPGPVHHRRIRGPPLPGPARRLLTPSAPLRASAHQVSGIPTAAGMNQKLHSGSRFHSGSRGPLST
jgi:hypothetical protein